MARKKLSPEQREKLLETLKARFEKNRNRHQGLEWTKVQGRLEANPDKLWSLNEMERTGGEPDVVRHDKKTGENPFFVIARRKVQLGGEVFVTTAKDWSQGKSTNRKRTPLIWLLPWGLSC